MINHDSIRMMWRLQPPIMSISTPSVHADCICNEYISVCNRVLGKVPKPTPSAIISLRRTMKSMLKYMQPVVPITNEEFIEPYTGPKRKGYLQAAKSLEADPINAFDARVKCFVKCERINMIEKDNPDPRMISYRSKRYVLEVGKYLKPLEHQLYTKKFWLKSRVIVKGLNPTERAKLLVKKMERFQQPLVLSLDCSRWDKHVSPEMLKLEHWFYWRLTRSKYLRWLLSM